MLQKAFEMIEKVIQNARKSHLKWSKKVIRNDAQKSIRNDLKSIRNAWKKSFKMLEKNIQNDQKSNSKWSKKSFEII
jgi:ribosomal 50S subunit-associated protein YjgA (DUF615 family)